MLNPNVIISGGGTGGHIFPALAIADAIRAIVPEARILFVGALGRMEMERVPAAGYPIRGLPIQGFRRSLSLGNVKVLWNLVRSLRMAGAILDEFKPDVAIGVGGYASGALLWKASGRGIPCLVQEQNSYPGVTNKLLKNRAQRICVAYPGMDRFFPAKKILLTGNPVRKDLENLSISRSEGLAFFGLRPDLKTILVLGGSLGARTLNESLLAHLDELGREQVQVIWQTGKVYFDRVKARVDEKEYPRLRVFPFIAEMNMAYAAADLVVSRAGAGTISEICLVGKASILVPSPNVTEDHQTHNAMALVNRNAAVLVGDSQAVGQLVTSALAMVGNESRLEEMRQNARNMAAGRAAEKIAREALSLISRK